MNATALDSLRDALERSAQAAEFGLVLRALERGEGSACGGLWGSAQSVFAAALAARVARQVLLVVSTDSEGELLLQDLIELGVAAEALPAREASARGALSSSDQDSVRGRLRIAQRLAGPREQAPRVLVASIRALLQPLPDARELERSLLHVHVGQKLPLESLVERLVASGYTRVPLVERAGELSLRGDILDVYPFASELPLRIELFGDEIEALRTFEPADQRSVESHKQISFSLARDAGDVEEGNGAIAIEMLDADALVVDVEPLRIDEQSETLRIRSALHARALQRHKSRLAKHGRLVLQSLPARPFSAQTRSVQGLAAGGRREHEALRALSGEGLETLVLCRTDAERARTLEWLTEHGGVPRGVVLAVGSLARGFRWPELGFAIVNHRELIGADTGVRAHAPRPQHRVKALESFFELRTGDLVVHAVHGLGLYQGLVTLERNGGAEDHLQLHFADDVALYVPASRIDLVQRYVGAGGQSAQSPPLDKIGGSSFRKRKEKVARALQDLAADLLEVQAQRETRRRPAWASDDELVADMLRAFPFTDTTDQVIADREIRTDLASKRPMDRLLCGDVGFGKTEIAMRAAFRVVAGGGQVAVLVPTTILAQQHDETFRERFAGFPVEIASLSRYTGAQEAREIARRTAAGEIDVLIGTHRILSSKIEFANLGLLVIDEEQRFGVAHKEHFKRMRASVDVLTLTATPIPRTLHMSLSGVRDISSLSVPPEGRQAVETRLGYREDDALLREILLHEKERGGQAFFLHNRVQSIEATALRLRRLVPQCSFVVGHGQMNGRELDRVMHVFTRHEADVLVSTAIVENGIDIPAAGTIVIDRADAFGLAELHQLRGRVGRGAQKSYCWLLTEESRPLSQVARERLKALEEMSQLGSGFGISMKDLELRGAGNILGAQQSGHIAAIGYDMYCQLLKQSIERMKRGATAEGTLEAAQATVSDQEAPGIELEFGLRALLPATLVASSDERLRVLRRMRAVRSAEDAAALARELRDRFGRLPEETLLLLRQSLVASGLEELGITRASWRGGLYVIQYRDRVSVERWLGELAPPRGDGRAELRMLRAGLAHLVLPARCKRPLDGLEWLERGLKIDADSLKMAAEAQTR
ncbi:MAG: transcription-repair coupling factor [Planctomycetota bacterium]|nr:MAG: transcription-repair coupling factor [Planctomycetota bacterium]